MVYNNSWTLFGDGGNIEFRQIEEGWTSKIQLPFNQSISENGQVRIFDDGEQYDKYTCIFSAILDAPNMALMSDVLESGFNNYNFSLFPSNASGFAPFSPAHGDEGTFNFNILDFRQTGTLDG